ncbi:cupin domain-containing protein [Gluconacetobacter sp.]|uniref:cupin domain-containing protein n=1 Tax=Gluconacetobacter sp. TaxID=1935994 RepID=UPI0039E80255
MLTVEDRDMLLEAGDSFRFVSLRPHRFMNAHDGESRVLWVNCAMPAGGLRGSGRAECMVVWHDCVCTGTRGGDATCWPGTGNGRCWPRCWYPGRRSSHRFSDLPNCWGWRSRPVREWRDMPCWRW